MKWNFKLDFICYLYLKTKQKEPKSQRAKEPKSQNNAKCLIVKVKGLYHLHRPTIFFELLTLDA